MKIGYARVLTKDQNLDLQIEALEKVGCEKIYQEKISGATKNRPELDEFGVRFNFIAVDYLIYTYKVLENFNQSYQLPLIA